MKYLKNQRGEVAALTVFLIGLVFTFIVSAKEKNDIKAELKQCETQQQLIMEAIK